MNIWNEQNVQLLSVLILKEENTSQFQFNDSKLLGVSRRRIEHKYTRKETKKNAETHKRKNFFKSKVMI